MIYIKAIFRTEKRKEFKKLFSHFSEPHHLRLGFSQEGNSEKGTTSSKLIKIFMDKDILSIILKEDIIYLEECQKLSSFTNLLEEII